MPFGRPEKIGSYWKSPSGFYHGPRVLEVEKFKKIYIKPQEWARHRHKHIVNYDIIKGKRLPISTRIKIGTLKKDNRLAIQSFIGKKLPKITVIKKKKGYRRRGKRVKSHRQRYHKRRKIGIKRKMGFVKKTTIPAIDHPDSFRFFTEKRIVKMSPDEFLRLTKKETESKYLEDSDFDQYRKWRGMSQEEYEKIISHEPSLKKLRVAFKKDKEIFAPNIEYDFKGRQTGHEGRHRAMVARELGIKEIPVVIVRNRDLSKPKPEKVKVIDTIPKEFE